MKGGRGVRQGTAGRRCRPGRHGLALRFGGGRLPFNPRLDTADRSPPCAPAAGGAPSPLPLSPPCRSYHSTAAPRPLAPPRHPSPQQWLCRPGHQRHRQRLDARGGHHPPRRPRPLPLCHSRLVPRAAGARACQGSPGGPRRAHRPRLQLRRRRRRLAGIYHPALPPRPAGAVRLCEPAVPVARRVRQRRGARHCAGGQRGAVRGVDHGPVARDDGVGGAARPDQRHARPLGDRLRSKVHAPVEGVGQRGWWECATRAGVGGWRLRPPSCGRPLQCSRRVGCCRPGTLCRLTTWRGKGCGEGGKSGGGV